MPKRGAEEKIAKYLKKIEKLKKKRRLMDLATSDSEQENDIGDAQMDHPAEVYYTNVDELEIIPSETINSQSIEEPTETSNAEEPAEIPSLVEQVEIPSTENLTTSDPELDPSILAALGEIVDDSPDFGEKIHESLTKVWTPVLKKGITKENRDKMFKEYIVPENCPLLKSPSLNPEVLAAIPEAGRFRDKKMSASQQQLGVGITAISRGLNTLLTSDKKVEAIKSISDGCRLLSDLHFQQTETRKKFITPCLDKSFLQLIQDTDRDDTLFGNTLPEKIKASKAIVTQSKQIKKGTITPKPATSQPVPRISNQGNWQGPPRNPTNRGGRGAHKRINQRVQHQTALASQLHPQPSAYQTRSRGTSRQPHHH